MQANIYNPVVDIEGVLDDSFQYWEVDEKGNITFKDPVNPMFISSDRLLEINWLTQELGKDRNTNYQAEIEFYFAYLQALRNAGVNQITISTTNINDLIV